MIMHTTGLLRRLTRSNQIDEVAARLSRRKRAVLTRTARLGETLYGKLTSPGALIIAGSTGYVIGELSRPRPDTERSPARRRSPRSLFNNASLWLSTASTLISWTHSMFVTPPHPRRSREQDVPEHSPADD